MCVRALRVLLLCTRNKRYSTLYVCVCLRAHVRKNAVCRLSELSLARASMKCGDVRALVAAVEAARSIDFSTTAALDCNNDIDVDNDGGSGDDGAGAPTGVATQGIVFGSSLLSPRPTAAPHPVAAPSPAPSTTTVHAPQALPPTTGDAAVETVAATPCPDSQPRAHLAVDIGVCPTCGDATARPDTRCSHCNVRNCATCSPLVLCGGCGEAFCGLVEPEPKRCDGGCGVTVCVACTSFGCRNCAALYCAECSTHCVSCDAPVCTVCFHAALASSPWSTPRSTPAASAATSRRNAASAPATRSPVLPCRPRWDCACCSGCARWYCGGCGPERCTCCGVVSACACAVAEQVVFRSCVGGCGGSVCGTCVAAAGEWAEPLGDDCSACGAFVCAQCFGSATVGIVPGFRVCGSSERSDGSHSWRAGNAGTDGDGDSGSGECGTDGDDQGAGLLDVGVGVVHHSAAAVLGAPRAAGMCACWARDAHSFVVYIRPSLPPSRCWISLSLYICVCDLCEYGCSSAHLLVRVSICMIFGFYLGTLPVWLCPVVCPQHRLPLSRHSV